jgi:hypothetical protein
MGIVRPSPASVLLRGHGVGIKMCERLPMNFDELSTLSVLATECDAVNNFRVHLSGQRFVNRGNNEELVRFSIDFDDQIEGANHDPAVMHIVFYIGEQDQIIRKIYGQTSIQAFVLALKLIDCYLENDEIKQ